MQKGQKMPEELRRKHSEYMKAHPINYWLGKKRGSLSQGMRKKLSDAQKLAYKEGRRKVSENTLNNIKNLNKGKFGKEHTKWTEDKKRPFYGAIRTLHQYRTWRTNIFERDNYSCQKCSKRGGDMEVDHNPKKFIDILRDNKISTIEEAINCKELWEAEGKTLCKKCHIKRHFD